MPDQSFPDISNTASAAISFIPIPLVIVFWVLSLKSRPIGPMGATGPVPIPIRLARLVLQGALPVYLVAIVFWTVVRSIRAALYAGARPPPGRDPMLTTVYLVHIVPGAVVAFCLLSLEVAYFGRRMDDVTRSKEASRQRQTSPSSRLYVSPSAQSLHWPLLVIDLVLLLAAVVCFFYSLYGYSLNAFAVPTMKKAEKRLVGSSVMWLVRSSYGVYVAVRAVQGNSAQSEREVDLNLILYPILEYLVGTLAMGLLVSAVRDGVWRGCVVHHFANPGPESEEKGGDHQDTAAMVTGEGKQRGPAMAHVQSVAGQGRYYPS